MLESGERFLDKAFMKFVHYESISRDIIDVKRIYIDMADDLPAGVLLSQIIYWYLPSKNGEDKLRVEHDGYLWIANTKESWWDQVRLTRRQFDRVVAILEKKELVVKAVYKFKGSPTVHLRLNIPVFLKAYNELIEKSFAPDGAPFALNGAMKNTKAVNGLHELVESSITENTTKTTNIDNTGKSPSDKKGKKDERIASTKVLAGQWCKHVGIDYKHLAPQDWRALKAMSKADISIDTLISMSKSKKAWKTKNKNLTYLNSERAVLLADIGEAGSESKEGPRFGSHKDLMKQN